MEDRILTVDRRQLDDPEVARAAFWRLHGIMLFPEDAEAQERYGHALTNEVIRQLPQVERDEVRMAIPGHTAYLAAMADEGVKVEDVLHPITHARKRGMLGATNVEGGLAGQILSYLLNSDIGSLDGAYDEVIKRVQVTEPIVKAAFDELLPGERLAVPSKSKLKEIWGNYKNVAHFWAADYALGDQMAALSLFDPQYTFVSASPDAPEVFRRFLGVAMFFRNKLIEASAPYQETPYISDGQLALLYNVLTEDGRQFPAIDLVLR